MKKKSQNANYRPSLLLALTGLILPITLTGCGLLREMISPRYIHFVLPDGYTGKIELVLDEADGVDVKSENGRYTYVIPQSGALKVKSFKPFDLYSGATAAYQNGEKIPSENSVDSKTVALRDLGGSGSRKINGKEEGPVILKWAIATKEQANQYTTIK